MSGYTLTAQTLQQDRDASRFLLIVSIFDSNGQAVSQLKENNFAVFNLTSDAQFNIAELQAAGVPGFYRLFLRPESQPLSGECILALLVKSNAHPAGRMPTNLESGNTMVKIVGG